MSARTLQTHNHASRAAAVAECMRAGMVPWHDRDYLLFAMPASRERYAIARYQHAGAPRWQIVPEPVLREAIAAQAASDARTAAAYAHALGEPEPAESAPGQVAAGIDGF